MFTQAYSFENNSDITIMTEAQLLDLIAERRARGTSEENLALMRLMDTQYLQTPFFGTRQFVRWFASIGYTVNRKRVRRLMQLMNLRAIYPRPRTTVGSQEHRVYPYLLSGLSIDRPDQVWASDITYVPMRHGFLYLVAVMDWYSRHVLSWRLSNTLDVRFCLEALEDALDRATPEIFNTDQGVQFTSVQFTGRLKRSGVAISMDGKGRVLDNIFIERLWRTVKYEFIYLREFTDGWELEEWLAQYLSFYTDQRPHSSLGGLTPAQVYRGASTQRAGSGGP